MEIAGEYLGQPVEHRSRILHEGFARVPHSLARAQDLALVPKMLLVVLISHADSMGTSWPSITLLAKEVGSSVSSIQRALRTLEAMGLISIERRKVAKENLTNRYIIENESIAGIFYTPAPPPLLPPGGTGIPPLVAVRHPEEEPLLRRTNEEEPMKKIIRSAEITLRDVEVLRVEYPTLNVEEELENCQVYWLHEVTVKKRQPPTIRHFRNWLKKATQFQEENNGRRTANLDRRGEASSSKPVARTERRSEIDWGITKG